MKNLLTVLVLSWPWTPHGLPPHLTREQIEKVPEDRRIYPETREELMGPMNEVDGIYYWKCHWEFA